MKSPLVTAIISTYKRPVEILKRAVVSVVQQTYRNLEIIIVNDYPENEKLSLEIKDMLSDFHDERIKYIIMDRNRGACAARNKGIEASHGQFIELLDDDDVWCERKTEMQLAAFTSEKIGLVYSPFYNIVPGSDKPQIITRGTISGNVFTQMIYRNIAGGCSMTMFSKKAIDDCGAFDERLLSSQDYDLYLRIAEKYDFAYVGTPLIYRYLLDESITRNSEKQRQGWELFTEKHILLYEKNVLAYSYRINRKVSELLESGDFKQAGIYYKRALSVKMISKHNIIEPLKGLGKFMGYRNKKDYKI